MVEINREIHRRRILAGDKASLNTVTAEVAVFLRYGKEPSINDILFHGKKVHLGSLDDDDLSFVVISDVTDGRWKVDSGLEYNTYVFVQPGTSTEYDIVGWLTLEELAEAPTRADGSFYEVTKEHMFLMPETYSFAPVCPRIPCDESGIWDYETDSWDCFGGCNKHRYDAYTSDHIAKQGD